MAKYKVIPIDIYGKEIIVFIGNHKEFKNWINNNQIITNWENLAESISQNEDDNALASFWFDIKYDIGVIELPWHPKNSTEIAIAAHEALHATFRLLDYVGVDYNANTSNESFTYLHEYILEKILNYNNYELIKK